MSLRYSQVVGVSPLTEERSLRRSGAPTGVPLASKERGRGICSLREYENLPPSFSYRPLTNYKASGHPSLPAWECHAGGHRSFHSAAWRYLMVVAVATCQTSRTGLTDADDLVPSLGCAIPLVQAQLLLPARRHISLPGISRSTFTHMALCSTGWCVPTKDRGP